MIDVETARSATSLDWIDKTSNWRMTLPPEHIAVLANPDDVRYEAYTGVDIVRAGRRLPQLVEAFRVGNPRG